VTIWGWKRWGKGTQGAGVSYTPSPCVCREGHRRTLIEHYCILGATGTTDSTAVAPSWVYYHFLVGNTVPHGSELAGTHTLATSIARVRLDFSHILRAEHYREAHGYSGPHRPAVRPVTVADASNKRGDEGPNGVTKPLLLQFSETGKSFLFG